jgi:hypothetical protein
MLEVPNLSVVVAAAAAFVMSSIWYTIFGKARMELLDQDPRATADMRKVPAWKKTAELVRELVIAYVVAHFVVRLGVVEWKAAVQLGVWLWFGFVFMILVGAVVWDNVPWKLTPVRGKKLDPDALKPHSYLLVVQDSQRGPQAFTAMTSRYSDETTVSSSPPRLCADHSASRSARSLLASDSSNEANARFVGP